MGNHMTRLDISTGGDLSDVYRPHHGQVTAPDGKAWLLSWNGLTDDPAQATAFANRNVALRAAGNMVHGDPNAFWESERRSAALARQKYRGWKTSAVPVGA